jgi:hypothetical protein
VAARLLPFRLAAVALSAVVAYFTVQIFAALVNGLGRTHRTATAKLPFPASTAHDLGILFAIFAAFVVVARILASKPTTEAWVKGARGEEILADRLSVLLSRGVALIHDRAIPGSSANIDLIAVAPSGVFVLDAKNVRGRVVAKATGSVWNPGPTKLLVGGRNRSEYLEKMSPQVATVTTALTALAAVRGVPITPMLVFVHSEWGWFPRPLRLRGVWVGWPKKAVEINSQPGPLTPEMIMSITARLTAVLQAA